MLDNDVRKDLLEVCKVIAHDQEEDASNFQSQPFNGKTVAEYFGNQGAAIAALANIVATLMEADGY